MTMARGDQIIFAVAVLPLQVPMELHPIAHALPTEVLMEATGTTGLLPFSDIRQMDMIEGHGDLEL